MIRPIVKYGDATVHRPAAPVSQVTPEIRQLVDDMISTMYAAPGVGLAAPQVGVPLRIFVVDVSLGRRAQDLQVVINPKVEAREGTQLEEEGCLSVPGFTATVVRPSSITVSGLDRDGQPQVIQGRELLARAIQHEIDHLDGVLMLDRLDRVHRKEAMRELREQGMRVKTPGGRQHAL
jgi:peptide deformylase